ncbi:unnamed protein product [Urochloa decumbens]|uniref:Protein TIFY n=1 Tax=Urochloa decumbens TaxID=240449 RepID=A0ABC9A4Z6_9POAL
MAKHEHPSADHALMHNPNSSSPSPRQAIVGSSPPPPPPLQTTTKMAGDFWMTSGATAAAASTTTAATTATKPLTMFYNGGVAVFHLPQDKAEDLMKMAAGEKGGEEPRPGARRANHGEELLAKLRQAEMPISSKRSLQRFFQKRKERLYRP